MPVSSHRFTGKHQVWLTLAVLMLMTAMGACTPRNAQERATVTPPAPEVLVFAVNVVEAVRGELNDYIQLNGDVEASVTVDLFADTAGKLTALNVVLGQFVPHDGIIGYVDPSRPGQDFEPNPVRSTIGGTVVNLPFDVGDTIGQGTPIAQVARIDSLVIRTSVAERYLSKMEIGRRALTRYEAWPGIGFPARVVELSPVVDPLTRTLDVKMELEEPDTRIRPGMYADIKLITDYKNGIVKIPADCIVERFGIRFVFVVQNETFEPHLETTVERREVEPGISIDNKAEIISGLNPGDLVVFQGQNLLEDGSRVRLVENIPPLDSRDAIR